MKTRTIHIPENFPVHELARFANVNGFVLDYTSGQYSFVPYAQAIKRLTTAKPPQSNTGKVVQMDRFRKPASKPAAPATTPDLIA